MHDLIIIGAGPAGCAAAIHAANLRPEDAPRILLLDKAHFPRVKICGGGIVRRADYLLHRLGVDPGVHSTPIDAATFTFLSGALTLRRRRMFRVVQRKELDHALLQHAESRGVQVRQETSVLDLHRDGEEIRVSTAHETLRARIVIGADGANGVARRKVLSGHRRLSMVGLETFTPPMQPELDPGSRRKATFDFTCVRDGVQGYSWDFPTGTEELPLVNRGIFHSHIAGPPARMSLKSYLANALHQRDIDVSPLQIAGHPAHIYEPSLPCSAPHLLLAGDAIGVEPLLGEGISSALETGILAAEAAIHALQSENFSFRDYAQTIRSSHRMRSVRMKRSIAARFYIGHPTWWALLGAIGVSAAYIRATQAWEGLSGRRTVHM